MGGYWPLLSGGLVMGAKHNKCCCSAPAVIVYAGIMDIVGGLGKVGRVTALDGPTGSLIGVLYTATEAISAIACDPTTGKIYITDSSSTAGVVKALNSSGGLLWTWTPGATAALSGLAVANDGYVYATSRTTGKVYKIDASSGTEITSGWPYNPGSASLVCVCVDQSGNVFTGGRISSLPTAAMLTSSGSIVWSATIANVTPGALPIVNAIAVDAGGTELAIGIATSAVAGLSDCYKVDAATGSINGSVYSSNLQQASAYSATAIAYSYVGGAQDGSGYTVQKELAGYYKTFTNTVQGIAVARDDTTYLGTQKGTGGTSNTHCVYSIEYGWTHDEFDGITNKVCACIDTNHGRLGAFGL